MGGYFLVVVVVVIFKAKASIRWLSGA